MVASKHLQHHRQVVNAPGHTFICHTQLLQRCKAFGLGWGCPLKSSRLEEYVHVSLKQVGRRAQVYVLCTASCCRQLLSRLRHLQALLYSQPLCACKFSVCCSGAAKRASQVCRRQTGGRGSGDAPPLVLRWCCAGAALVLRWCCAGAALVLRWCCACAALALSWCCAGAKGQGCWHQPREDNEVLA